MVAARPRVSWRADSQPAQAPHRRCPSIRQLLGQEHIRRARSQRQKLPEQTRSCTGLSVKGLRQRDVAFTSHAVAVCVRLKTVSRPDT